jgi:hypothetical protein
VCPPLGREQPGIFLLPDFDVVTCPINEARSGLALSDFLLFKILVYLIQNFDRHFYGFFMRATLASIPAPTNQDRKGCTQRRYEFFLA